MSERPVLFSGEMVRAILEGRKTQTRRVVLLPKTRQQPLYQPTHQGGGMWADSHCLPFRCPYGEPGDLLWVRETWFNPDYEACGTKTNEMSYYRATDVSDEWSWRPSIHMPKWAARLWLRVTDVRVERLQDISEEDARAEASVKRQLKTNYGGGNSATWHFRRLWDSINAKRGYGWDTNPWVWVVSFEREDKA
jgi:hypothetical protein